MTANAVSQAGLALIQDYECFRAEPAPLPGGLWLVGYGHVSDHKGEPVNQDQALELLRADLAPYEALVAAKVALALTQPQFDALVSFAFSIGAEAFAQSQVLRRVNAGEFAAAACAMDAWRKSTALGEPQVFEALIARRAAEKAMFMQDLPRRAAPSALLRAQVDHAASILGAPVRYATAPEIASAPASAADLEASAPVAESLYSQALEPLLLTQVVANDVGSDIAAANDAADVAAEVAAAADGAADAPADGADDDAADAGGERPAEVPPDHAAEAAAKAAASAANDTRPSRPIVFVELPIDRRIRDGRQGGLADGVRSIRSLKSLWGAWRSPNPERA